MTTEKYKCISTHYGIGVTCGNYYEIDIENISFINDRGQNTVITERTLNLAFQKVEPTTTQPMKYKVTITSADHTGHEETIVHENVTNEGVVNYFNSSQSKQPQKTILIEPMPEKKKVTVWFYVIMLSIDLIISVSNTSEESVIKSRNSDIEQCRKVSEIKSMEVEI